MDNPTTKGYIHSRFAHVLRPKYHKLKLYSATAPFDWSKGYSVEDELKQVLNDVNFKLPVKDQGLSSSCGGQTASSLESVNEAFLTKQFIERSAKDAYSHTFYPEGGTTSPRLESLMIHRGIAFESFVPSYDHGQPPSEAYMTHVDDSPEITANANKSIDTASVSVDYTNFDSMATAIRDLKGVALALVGENNGSWRSPFPKPPADGGDWGHFVYCVGAVTLNGKRYIKILNSWGLQTGENGFQYLGEEYIPYFKDCFGIIDTSTVQPALEQSPWTAILIYLQAIKLQLQRLLTSR